MKSHLLEEVARQATVLNRIRLMAELLPDDGPRPFHIGTYNAGKIYYARGFHDNYLPLLGRVFGTDGWVSDKWGNMAKTLPNGVEIEIQGNEPSKEQPVDPSAFGSETTPEGLQI